VTWSTGDYFFTDRTTSWSLATGVAVSTSRWTAPGTLPSGGRDASRMVGDSGHGRRGAVPGLAQRRVPAPASSLTGYEFAPGDPQLQLSLRLAERDRFAVDAFAGVKAPLTDTAQFGTGLLAPGRPAISSPARPYKPECEPGLDPRSGVERPGGRISRPVGHRGVRPPSLRHGHGDAPRQSSPGLYGRGRTDGECGGPRPVAVLARPTRRVAVPARSASALNAPP
jgi:hypothetical protein